MNIYRPYAQDPKNIFGKVISINKEDKKNKIIAMGLRNPQGLFMMIMKIYYLFQNMDLK